VLLRREEVATAARRKMERWRERGEGRRALGSEVVREKWEGRDWGVGA